MSRESGSTRGGDLADLWDTHHRAVPAQAGGVMRLRLLDRYVLRSWFTIFVLTALGFPLVSIIINMTDNLEKLLDRGLTLKEIAASYFYALPENVFLVMPAAVLFATVFTVGHSGAELGTHRGQGRRPELPPDDLPASTSSALLAVGLAVVVGELAPGATAARARAAEIQAVAAQDRSLQLRLPRPIRAGCTPSARSTSRTGRCGRSSSSGRVPGQRLSRARGQRRQRHLRGLPEVRGGSGPATAGCSPERATSRISAFRPMRLQGVAPAAGRPAGGAQVSRGDALRRACRATSTRSNGRATTPASSKWIARSSSPCPQTCLVIALFGAPLAVTSPRQGTAIGIAISLGTTLIFLSMIQLSKAVGTSGTREPGGGGLVPQCAVSSSRQSGSWRCGRVR